MDTIILPHYKANSFFFNEFSELKKSIGISGHSMFISGNVFYTTLHWVVKELAIVTLS